LSEMGQGLTLSGVGILITFGALGALIVLILVLKALFPAREAQPTTAMEGSEGPQRTDALRKRAAAAGVAALLGTRTTKRTGSLGKALESPPGEWWRKGLDRIHGKE
jgi:hypothetical protein